MQCPAPCTGHNRVFGRHREQGRELGRNAREQGSEWERDGWDNTRDRTDGIEPHPLFGQVVTEGLDPPAYLQIQRLSHLVHLLVQGFIVQG
jgi:hypothetical protein